MGNDLEPKPQTTIKTVKSEKTFVTVAARDEFMPMLEPVPETGTITLAQVEYDNNDVMREALLTCRTESNDGRFQLKGEVLFTLPEESRVPTWEEPFFVHLMSRVDGAFDPTRTHMHRDPISIDVHVSEGLLATIEIQRDHAHFLVKIATSLTQGSIHQTRQEATHDRYTALLNTTLLWAHVQDAVMAMYANPEHDRNRKITLKTPSLNIKLPKRELIDEEEPDLTFDDIIGYDDVKQELLNMAISFEHPELAKSIGLESTEAILLHGIGGTGKTSLLKALANEIDANLFELNVSDIIDKWVGASATNLDDYFNDLKNRDDKIVVLIDEFDSIGVSADSASSGERVDTVNRLKDHIVDILAHHHNILLVGATNNINRVDKALVRPGRFRTIEIKAPDFNTRRAMWLHVLGKAFLLATTNTQEASGSAKIDIDLDNDINIVELAQKSEGMVGAHPKEILNAIRRARINEFMKTKKMSPITQKELLEHIGRISHEEN
jgi:AAA+ superfamily predicted ATPase